ncbi:MAG: GAF domain-containing protein [bacterium]|nr:GAF domain-containing protein [bacterium]
MEIQSAFMGTAAAAVLLIAILVQRRETATLSFAALTLAYGLWCFGRGMAGLGLEWGHEASQTGLLALGPTALTSALYLTERNRYLSALRPLLLLPPVVMFAGVVLEARPRELSAAIHVWAFAGVLAGAWVLARFSPLPAIDASPEHVRLRYLSIAHAIVILGVAGDLILWQFELPRVGTLLPPLLYLYAGYLHLARVRVADLRQLMGNAIALTLMAVCLAGFFAGIRIWVGERIDLFVFNAFIASFALLFAFEPMRERIQAAMDRRFVAERLELERSLEPLRERLGQILSLDELLLELFGCLEKTHQLRASSLFLRDDANVGFQQAGSIGLSPRTRVSLMRDPTFVSALEESPILLASELEVSQLGERDTREHERLETLLRILRGFDAQLVLPLCAEDQVVGFWTLSDARSEESFSTDEIRLLRQIADLVAVSIQNSKTFERIRARDRLASLGEMATGLAHEIRNPLAAIRGAIAVLDSDDDQNAEFHELIVEEVLRLNRVVESFLDYARPSTHNSVIKGVGQFVEECARSVIRAQAESNIQITIEAEDDLPTIRGDATQLERVLINIVQNAFEALEDSGRIQIHTRSNIGLEGEAAGVEIVIEDDGPGMDEATHERAFVPFFTTKERGTGMGLALCERLIRSQNGSIELHSRPGEGTLVRILLSPSGPEGPEEEQAA